MDLIASQEFLSNFICWKDFQNTLIGLKTPKFLVTWNKDNGAIISHQSLEDIDFTHFRKHSEWNEMTLLKEVKEEVTEEPEQLASPKKPSFALNLFNDKGDSNGNPLAALKLLKKKMPSIKPQNQIFYQFLLIDIVDQRRVDLKCKFMFEYKHGMTLYASYPYLLVMDENQTKFYKLEEADPFHSLTQLWVFPEQ